MLNYLFSSLGLFLLADNALCTTEWFGDDRAHMNPPKYPPFYDIVYDDSDCPFGLESVAIPEFVYFGEMIATKSLREHSECLQFCLETTRCKAVNFFESMSKKDPGMGFCELLVEGQYDNPRLMRPFRKATYYEKIHCRVLKDGENEEQPFAFSGNDGKELLIGEKGHKNNKSEVAPMKGEEGGKDEGERSQKQKAKMGKNEGQQNNKQTSPQTTETSHGTDESTEEEDSAGPSTTDLSHMLNFKELADLVQKFNERFKS